MRSRLGRHQPGGCEIANRVINKRTRHVKFDSADRQRVDSGVQASGRIKLLLDPRMQIGLD
jgi:hypothetical protein